jgi:hypothetical protein
MGEFKIGGCFLSRNTSLEIQFNAGEKVQRVFGHAGCTERSIDLGQLIASGGFSVLFGSPLDTGQAFSASVCLADQHHIR